MTYTHLFANLRYILVFFFYTGANKIDDILAGHEIPNAVACQHHKFVVFGVDSNMFYIRESRNHLLRCRQLFVLLVSVITECPREVKTAVDSTVGCNFSTSFANAFHFWLVLGFMVQTEVDGLAISTQDTPRVSGVGYVQIVALQHRYDSRTSTVRARL